MIQRLIANPATAIMRSSRVNRRLFFNGAIAQRGKDHKSGLGFVPGPGAMGAPQCGHNRLGHIQ